MRRFLFLLILLSACQIKDIDSGPVSIEIPVEIKSDSIDIQLILKTEIDSIYTLINLIDITSFNDGIRVDVKYASTDNFMGVQLYDTITSVYLARNVAHRLSKCQSFLDSIHPGYHLLVYDGIRPLQVQQEMWDALDSIPVYRRGKFVSNPVRGSVHNYGAAVDLTIVNEVGDVLDMGAEYDDFHEIAFPRLEKQFLASGELSKKQVENRRLLRRVMRSQQFRNIPSEWWHFNANSRITASHLYQRLLNESGKSDWHEVELIKKDSLIDTVGTILY